MTSYDVARDELIFSDSAGQDSELFMLLSGAARFSCLGVKRGRIAIAIFPPGMIPRAPVLAHFHCQFRCEALRHSRVARLSRDSFIEIVLGVRIASFERVANLVFGGFDNLLTRYPGFTGLDLRSRVALALLELGASFGAQNTRGGPDGHSYPTGASRPSGRLTPENQRRAGRFRSSPRDLSRGSPSRPSAVATRGKWLNCVWSLTREKTRIRRLLVQAIREPQSQLSFLRR
jgi:hypothetical protein